MREQLWVVRGSSMNYYEPISTFNNSGKCGACRYQEQLMRKRHGGAYSKAGTK